MKNKGGFLKSNWAYLIWFCLYFAFAVYTIMFFTEDIWESLLITTLVYGSCVGLALSPLGEIIVRFAEGAKPIQTQEDKDYLIPIFGEVYEEAKDFSPKINKDINLYVTDSMAVNAFAVGRKTVAVTRGAIYTFSPDELKGVLAHELGHMVNGDTKALLIKLIGNGFFSIIIFVLRFIVSILENISLIIGSKNIVLAVISFITVISRIAMDLYIIAFVFVGDLIIALNSRYSEYLADEYAYLIGYGEDLKNSLYILNKISMPRNIPLLERLKASHPHTTARIERLEQLEQLEKQSCLTEA